MSVAYRRATIADGLALARMGQTCFDETFGAHFAASDLAKHYAHMFGSGGLPAELADPATKVMMAQEGGSIAGYLKLAPMGLPIDHPQGSLEIRQLYVLTPWQGAGVAAALMDWAIETARGDGAPALFLSVWTKGGRAQAFYRRYGFTIVGEAPFTIGGDRMIDPVMRRDL